MTERLYWYRPEMKRFTARLINVMTGANEEGGANNGSPIKVWLDQTLFYPEGGGQPCDIGYLKVNGPGASLPVTRVTEGNDGIVHYVCSPPDELDGLLAFKGREICGEIDWGRRFDHMQQHTGQHILSRAFLRVLGVNTTGFHMSQDYASIDLDVAEINQVQVQKVEQLANKVVFSNVPVKAEEYKPGDLRPSVRRRLPKETAIVRVIEIGDFDACACGGTHVSSTGQVGLIKISEVGRAHGGVRVVFRCGGRALADYQKKNEAAWVCARLLSVPVDSIDSGVQSLLVQVEEQELEVKRLQRLALELEAGVLSNEAAQSGGLFVKRLPGKEADQLRWLAKEVAAKSGQPAILFDSEPKFCAAIASPVITFDARMAAKRLTAAFGARGGGNQSLAQVGSKDALALTDEEASERVRYLCYNGLKEG